GYDRRGRIGSAAQPRKPLPGALVALRCQELAVPAGVQGRSAGQVPDAHSSDRRSVDRSTITRIENKFGRAIPRTKSVFRPAARNPYTLASSIEQLGGQDLVQRRALIWRKPRKFSVIRADPIVGVHGISVAQLGGGLRTAEIPAS